MFARCVTIRIKPENVAELNRTIENSVVPLLRKQKGFREEITLLGANGTEVLGISLWDNRESAEAYQRTAFAEVQRLLANVTTTPPQVQTYEVGSTTLKSIATQRGAAS
jgi:heme-degrading monooxygenase HmoA